MASRCVFCFLFFSQSFLHAQVLSEWEIKSENFHHRIKNIEFFIDRFNNQTEGSGKVETPTENDTTSFLRFLKERDSKIFSLFDHNLLNRKDTGQRNMIRDFFRDINNPYDLQFLHFEDSCWFAEVPLQVLGHEKRTTVKAILQVARIREGVYAWTIRSFYSEELKIRERLPKNCILFPPSAHGTDFMDVRLKLNDKAWLEKVREQHNGFTSAFADKLISGEMKIERTGIIVYHFLPLKNWLVTVQYVERESKNSGWLIRQLIPMDSDTKTLYRKTNYLD